MGFSISAATALIFASLFLAFGIFYPAMANGYERVEEADAAKADQNLDQAQTDIALISSTVTGNTLRIDVNNTGQTALTVDEVDLIVDGDYIPNAEYNTDVNGDAGTNLWLPNEELSISYNGGGMFSPNRFKVVTEHGISISGDT